MMARYTFRIILLSFCFAYQLPTSHRFCINEVNRFDGKMDRYSWRHESIAITVNLRNCKKEYFLLKSVSQGQRYCFVPQTIPTAILKSSKMLVVSTQKRISRYRM